MNAVLPTAFFPPVEYFSALKSHPDIFVEHNEHFVKQTIRNRCEIYGANGKLTLSVPLNYWKEKTKTKDILISYDRNWQKQHWKSIESAYRKSPYFEFYEEEFSVFFNKIKFELLVELNEKILHKILSLLKLEVKIDFTSDYKKDYETDFRNSIGVKKKSAGKDFSPYRQTFENKFGFIANLSILDLIFNEGPNAKNYF